MYEQWFGSTGYNEVKSVRNMAHLKLSRVGSPINHSSEKTLFGKTTIKIPEGVELRSAKQQ
jgi:hypothetical protein